MDERVRDPELGREALRVADEVLGVDPDEDHVLAAPLPVRGLEAGHLLLARVAPRRPEVDHDRLAAQRRKVDLLARPEARQREVGRDRVLAGGELRAQVRRVVVGDLPDEECEEPGHEGHGERLRGDLHGARHG